jgi:16S rRNA (cytosine1402-N4)-methyltransferase
LLAPGGRLVVISFHSGEDAQVKEFYKRMEVKALAAIISKKPILPKKAEINKNPRSRSAKMRVLEKT